MPRNTQKALFGALGARCTKSLKKHFGEHFPAQALLSSPVNGGRDRKFMTHEESVGKCLFFCRFLSPHVMTSFVRRASLQKCGGVMLSVFLCQRCREIRRESFRVPRFPGFGRPKRKISRKSMPKPYLVGISARKIKLTPPPPPLHYDFPRTPSRPPPPPSLLEDPPPSWDFQIKNRPPPPSPRASPSHPPSWKKIQISETFAKLRRADTHKPPRHASCG